MWVFVNICPVNVVVIHVNHFFRDLNFLYMQGINFCEDFYLRVLVIFNTLWSKVFDKKKKHNYKIHLSPSLVISVRLPIVSGISGMSLC